MMAMQLSASSVTLVAYCKYYTTRSENAALRITLQSCKSTVEQIFHISTFQCHALAPCLPYQSMQLTTRDPRQQIHLMTLRTWHNQDADINETSKPDEVIYYTYKILSVKLTNTQKLSHKTFLTVQEANRLLRPNLTL